MTDEELEDPECYGAMECVICGGMDAIPCGFLAQNGDFACETCATKMLRRAVASMDCVNAILPEHYTSKRRREEILDFQQKETKE